MADTSLAPWLQDSLARLLGQRGHAWLLTGMKGLGQFDLAKLLAASWLCEQPIEAGTPQAAAHLACGVCEACAMVRAHSHPDLLVLLPETLSLELGFPLDEKTQKELDEKKRKPSKQVKIDAVQDLITFTQRTSSRGKGLVVLIYPAEAMNVIASNALLKSLEEPAGHSRFVLATEDSAALLPTIRSRCQSFTLTLPSEAASIAWLVAQGVSSKDADVWLRAAGGQPQTAMQLSQSGMKPQAWLDLPRKIAAGEQPSELADAVVGSPAALSGVLQKICHDMSCHVQGAAPRFFDAQLLPPVPNSANAAQGALYKLTSWAKALNGHVRASEHTLKPDLMIEAMLHEASQALQFR